MDDRTYRTELEQRVDWGDRWALYVDGRLIARSLVPLGHLAAQAWACRCMGESVTWLTGRIDATELWYWVANPEQARRVIRRG